MRRLWSLPRQSNSNDTSERCSADCYDAFIETIGTIVIPQC